MLSNKFMQHYISFLTMVMAVSICGAAYYFSIKYLSNYFGPVCQLIVAITLGILAVVLAHKMMVTIEDDKERVIEETEQLAARILKKINGDKD